MKRVLLDTNIYGLLIVDPMRKSLKEKLIESNEYVVYGLSIIRKELRDTPRDILGPDGKLRIFLLQMYDDITKLRSLETTRAMEDLAQAYYLAYREFGGLSAHQEIIKDFIIVACSSARSMDIIVSHDQRTMLSPAALKAYALVNKIKKLAVPRFINYENFKKELR